MYDQKCDVVIRTSMRVFRAGEKFVWSGLRIGMRYEEERNLPYRVFELSCSMFLHKFTHSGIDVFTLARTDTGWKILDLAFTIEPNAPSQHPGGAPAVTTKK